MKGLSIIIPVYNVASYLEKCIYSLEEQDIAGDDYEIICINDGSSDDSHEIIEQLQKKFSNILLVDQANQGVSRARNNGIERASGRYLLFIDADDFVDTNCFERILKNVREQKAQVSFLGYTILNVDGSVRHRVFYEDYKTKTYKGTEAYYLARGDGKIDPDRIYAVIFETGFLNSNNLRFLPDVPFLEDGEFISRILSLADRCIFDGYSFYQRTMRPGSAVNSRLFFSEKSTNGFLLAASSLKNFQLKQELDGNQKDFLNQPIAKFVILAIDSSLGRKSYIGFVTTIKNLRKLSFRKVEVKNCNKQYRRYGKAYNLSPWLLAAFLTISTRLNIKYLFDIIRKNLLRK
jgi:glycosyltransferase involved in cell wall biosynthesis